MEVLCEIPESVIKIIPLGCGGANLGVRAPTLLLTKHSIILINGENGSLSRKYDMTSFFDAVVDCVYVSNKRSFVAQLSDSSLVMFPEQCSTLADMQRERWPVRPQRLLALDSDLVVLCDGGHLCKAQLKGTVQCPIGAMSPFVSAPVSVDRLAALSSSSSHVAVAVNGTIANGKKAKQAPLTVYLWPMSAVLSSSSAVWMTAASASCLTLSQATAATHLFLDECSISMVLPSLTQAMWLKVSLLGEELLHRELPMSSAAVFRIGGDLWTADPAGTITGYYSRYGSKLFEHPVGRRLSGPLSCCQFDEQTAAANLLLATAATDDGPSVLYATVLQVPAREKHNLFAAMTMAEDGARVVHTAPLGKTPSTSTDSLCSRLSVKDMNALSALQAAYHAQVAKENDLEKVRRALASKKRKADDEDSSAAAMAFSALLAGHTDSISSMDWEYVKPLVRRGDITLADHAGTSLLAQAMQAGRMDVLTEMLRYTPDLQEADAIAIIRHSLEVPEASLRQLTVVGCAVWCTAHFAYDPSSGTFLPSTQAKKSKGISRMRLLQAVMESALLRPSAFPVYGISEAVQAALSPAASALLLRVLALIISGICSARLTPRTVLLHCGEQQVQRAVGWMEGLLDGHLATFALEAKHSAGVRTALARTIDMVSGAEAALLHAEDLVGVCAHMQRAMGNKGCTAVQPIDSLYQVEDIDL